MFMYLTRSYDEGYRVFINSGTRADDEISAYFDDLLKYSTLKDTGSSSAALFRLNGKIYLFARSMDTGRRDKDTRNILFTFCFELQAGEAATALKIFSRLVNNWESAEQYMRSCLTGSLTFDYSGFTAYMKNYPSDSRLTIPAKNYVAKCVKDSQPQNIKAVRERGKFPRLKRGVRWALCYLGAVIVVVLVTMLLQSNSNSKHIATIIEEAESYAQSVSVEVNAVVSEFAELSQDVAGHYVISGDIEKLSQITEQIKTVKNSLPKLKEQLDEAADSLELSRSRIRSINNADSDEAEQLAKLSREAADNAKSKASEVREKINALRLQMPL